MKIRPLNKETYAGTSFTARYRTGGFYDIRPSESGFRIEYVPFEAPVEKSFTDELFGKWLEDPVAFGAFENGKLLGFVEGSMESWNNRFRISNICVFDRTRRHSGIGTALMRAMMERFANVRQLQLLTDDTGKTLAFYRSLGLRELSAFGCRGFMR